MTNCPNCGAVITGAKCEYCGTVFEKEEPPEKEVATLYADGVPIIELVKKMQSVGQITKKEYYKMM